MVKQLLRATGYLSILLMPMLLAFGVWLRQPAFAFAVCMLVLPLARTVFGALPAHRSPLWAESVATVLHWLPWLYVIALWLSLAWVLWVSHLGEIDTAGQLIGLGLSLWATLLFATCVAHELFHRRGAREVTLGSLLAGTAGYPLLVDEHLLHHARAAEAGRAECPDLEESAWAFAWRRGGMVLREAAGSPGTTRRTLALGATGFVAASFLAAGGWPAMVTYLLASAGVMLGVQLITYIQHWGLPHAQGVRSEGTPIAWEEDCRFQAWITLHTSLHEAHHREPRRPYYQLSLAPNSPRLPAGYLLLLVVCLVPPLWQRVMRPVLEHWRRQPLQPLSAGRRLTCFGHVPAGARPRTADPA
jgi:Fatty acid desaturase